MVYAKNDKVKIRDGRIGVIENVEMFNGYVYSRRR